jgi:hypothetical protein
MPTQRIQQSTARPERKLRAARVGPWLLEDYRSFRRLCNDALRLEPLEPTVPQWALGSRQPSSFPNVEAAERAFRGHVLYQWLATHVPRAVAARDKENSFVGFRRARYVVEQIIRLSLQRASYPRLDKQRRTVRAAITRVQQAIDNGTLFLVDGAQEEMLEHLLDVATNALSERRTKRDVVKYPALQDLAIDLLTWTGTADPDLLLEVAAARGFDFDERSARRYAATAKKRAGLKLVK